MYSVHTALYTFKGCITRETLFSSLPEQETHQRDSHRCPVKDRKTHLTSSLPVLLSLMLIQVNQKKARFSSINWYLWIPHHFFTSLVDSFTHIYSNCGRPPLDCAAFRDCGKVSFKATDPMSSSHSLWKIRWILICALPHLDDLPANIDVSWFGPTKPTGFDGSQRASWGQAARIWWIENAACVVWKALLRTIWPVSHHLSHISSSAFSIQAGEKHPSWPTRRSPQMGKSGSSQSSPGASLAPVPPRFYNALQLLRKALLGNKNSLCKWATSEKESCHCFFRRSHGLIHYTATGSEQRHLWAPLEVCIQIHTKKKKKKKFKGSRFF